MQAGKEGLLNENNLQHYCNIFFRSAILHVLNNCFLTCCKRERNSTINKNLLWYRKMLYYSEITIAFFVTYQVCFVWSSSIKIPFLFRVCVNDSCILLCLHSQVLTWKCKSWIRKQCLSSLSITSVNTHNN